MDNIKEHCFSLTAQQEKAMDIFKKQKRLLPHIEIDETHNRATLYYSFWNDWKGLVAAKLQITYEQGSIRWGEREERILVPYHCGVRF